MQRQARNAIPLKLIFAHFQNAEFLTQRLLIHALLPFLTYTQLLCTRSCTHAQDDRNRMLIAARNARPAFRYDVPIAPYPASGAFELIMLELWMRKLHDASRR